MKTKILVSLIGLLGLLGGLVTAEPLGTAFTYQGQLAEGGNPAQGIYDFRFAIYDALADGNKVGGPLTNAAVVVSNGLFTVALDFGNSAFAGEARWIEIGVRTNGGGAFSPLSPRHPLTAAPYALYAPNAGLLEGRDSSSFAPAAGSTAYVAKAGDTMTGRLHLPADGLIVGAEQLALTNGNVGIGTAAPAERLEVAGNLWYSGQLSKLNTAETWEAVVRSADFKLGHSSRRGTPGIALGDAWPNLFVNYDTNWPNTIIESKVGIQTRTPAAELDVNGTVRAAALEGSGTFLPFRLSGSETMRLEREPTGPWLRLTGPGGSGAQSALDLTTYDPGTNAPSARLRATDDYWSSSLDVLLKQAGASTNALVSRLRLRPNGNVAIDPTASNDGALTPGLIFGEDGSGEGIASKRTAGGNQWGLDFYTGFSNRLTILNNGNVGIATTTPTALLDVNGTVAAAKFLGDGSGLTGLTFTNTGSTTNADTLDGLHAASFWQTVGNAATSADFLGTTTNSALEMRVNNARALRLEPNAVSPNLIGGHPSNFVAVGTCGATIAGGGAVNYWDPGPPPQWVTNVSPNNINSNASWSAVGGGASNTIETNAQFSVIGGGWLNSIGTNGSFAVIGGGRSNSIAANALDSVVGGGKLNAVKSNADNGTIGGGTANVIDSRHDGGVIAGGDSNCIGPDGGVSTIGGGNANLMLWGVTDSTIGGGAKNQLWNNNDRATISGGGGNQIQANCVGASIAGGVDNNIGQSANYSTVGGGHTNAIQSSAICATIPGGSHNIVGASYGFAAGRSAQALHQGAFVWADSQNTPFASTANDQFLIRATNGVGINKNNPVSALDVNGTVTAFAFNHSSDKHLKETLTEVSPREVLKKVAALPIARWNFKGDAATPHLGPMAQDFHAAFGLGTDDKHIATVDADGVALAAIQGLHEVVKEKDAEIQALKHRLERLEQLLVRRGGGGQ